MTQIKKYFVFAFCAFVVSNTNIIAQINEGGTPMSFKNKQLKALSDLKYETMPSFDVLAMKREDSLNRSHAKPYRFAKGFNVSYSLTNSGTWESLDNGDKLWRLGIKSPNAFSINIIFSDYYIPEGAKVFIYCPKTSEVIGAFSYKNNSESHVLATLPVAGDEIIIEYFEPKDVSFNGKLTIGKVSHDYVGIKNTLKKTTGEGINYGVSQTDCEIDIRCNDYIYKNAVLLIC
jgi:lysyl endopeptidase